VGRSVWEGGNLPAPGDIEAVIKKGGQGGYKNDQELLDTRHAMRSWDKGLDDPDSPHFKQLGGTNISYNRGTLDRSALDRGAETRVTGTGKLSVDVRAPRGTKVEAEGGGLFKKTEIDRQTQMEPAQSAPARRGGGDETMSI
jgi:hypothetical protein